MAKKFVENESFLHKAAKELLFSWLKEEQDSGKDCCNVAQFSWRSNYGVFMELPFFDTDDPYYFENSSGIIDFDSDGKAIFKPNNQRGEILFVPDICVFHKGTPIYLFEIVHTSPVSDSKMAKIEKFFNGYHAEVIQIDAHEILRHTKKPSFLKCETVTI